MKFRKKIFFALAMVVVLINIAYMNFGSVQAASSLLDNILTGMNGVQNTTSEIEEAKRIINTVIGLIQVAGTGIAIISITILGIKYMTASAGEKAEIKKHAIPIVIGCLILFLAVNIMAIVADVGDTLNSIGP